MISCNYVREAASGSHREAGTRTYKLRSRFNVRRRWPLHVRCRRKKVDVRYLICWWVLVTTG